LRREQVAADAARALVATDTRDKTMKTMKLLALLFATGLGGMGLALAHNDSVGAAPMLLGDSVREANSRFQDVAVAEREGYTPIPCASGVDGGAMGIHYVNAALIGDGPVDVAKPQAVMYEPTEDGMLELVAVEYITTKGPASLGGHLFNFTGAPNRYGLPAFYELHVWAWKRNPSGLFADMNPNVSCDAMTGH
jgi:hypothetical protein